MEPTLSFIYNSGETDTPYAGTGAEDGDWKIINPVTDKIVFTGGGILGLLPTPTCPVSTRDATIRPSSAPYIIPQTYVETDTIMQNVPLVGHNQNRYCMGVYVDGTVNSDLYLEAFDDNTYSTTDLLVLQGTAGNGNVSCVNVIRTTETSPPSDWNGASTGAAHLRGSTDRIGLANSSSVTNESVYFNVYIELPTDISTFNETPVLTYRYLYS